MLRIVQWAFTTVITVCVFSIVAAVGLAIWVAWAEPLKAAEAQECTVEQAAQVDEFLKKNPERQTVTIEGDEVRKFLLSLSRATNGRLDLPSGPKLVFISFLPKGWKMVGHGEPKDGKSCVMGAIDLPTELVAKAIEGMADTGI